MPLRKSTRERRSTIRSDYVAFVTEHQGNGLLEDDPDNYLQAVEGRINATNDPLKSMENNDVWDLVPSPEGVKPIGCKWVFKN